MPRFSRTPTPSPPRAVSRWMSIDKESNGIPQVDVHRRTTKVNVAMVAAILVFFGVAAAVAFWVSRRETAPSGNPAPSSRNE